LPDRDTAAAKQCGAARLALHGISKRYGKLIANDRIDLSVAAGEIHGLVGENGAGKSSLMKVIYGVTQPDAGRIEWEGRAVAIRGPAQARRLGLAMVFQHFSLLETLTVAENISLALDQQLPAAALTARINDVSQRYGLPVDVRRLVHGMSVGERQRVEIVRCLLQSPRLLILDEPTSVLTPQAVRALFQTLRRLAAEGVSIIYISHKLDEIRELCDVATVLRGGRVIGTSIPNAHSNAELARMMIGDELRQCMLEARLPGAIQLELTNLSLASQDPFGTALTRINLRVRGGEMVGIAGVSGNGQKELLAAISGERRGATPGAIRLCGQDVTALDPVQRRRLGLRFVPEERLGRGAVPGMDLADNCVLTGASSGLVRRGLVQASAAREFARATIEQFAVKCEGAGALAETLSGGNLQKFVVGREIRLQPVVMLAAQPTWGVDVGASLKIRQALIGLRDAGVAVLVISEELDELYAICDRVAVLAGGRLSHAAPTADLPAETIGRWMSGEFLAAGPASQAEHVAL
jgi:simple sugar transport system ATP-binding protein